jgi:hypothetical protein
MSVATGTQERSKGTIMLLSRRTAKHAELVSIQFVDGVARGTLTGWSTKRISWCEADPTTRRITRRSADARAVVSVIALARDLDE